MISDLTRKDFYIMKLFFLYLGLAIMLLAPLSQTQALTLAQALNAQKVCEKQDGFLKATPGNEPETALLVAHVNSERQRVYADIAARDNVDPATVAREMARVEMESNPCRACK